MYFCQECNKFIWKSPIHMEYNTAKKKMSYFCKAICRYRWIKRVYPKERFEAIADRYPSVDSPKE